MGRFSFERRRKLGMLTAVIALIFVAAWGRSRSVNVPDQFAMPIGSNVEYRVVLGPAKFRVMKVITDNDGTRRSTVAYRIVEASYWSVIVPMSLLSAYLLLASPRIAKADLLGDK